MTAHEAPPTWDELFPPFGLQITAGELTLRVLRDDDLPTLVALARAGIHDGAVMPFAVPWTDVAAEELGPNTVRYHWAARAGFRPDQWALEFGVWRKDELVGVQGLVARDFPTVGTATTGSWLGRAHQGQGIGTAMRRAVCTFAIDHLGAARVTSEAFVDNPASIAVSRAVGYRDNGRRWCVRRGLPAEELLLVLDADRLVRGEHEVIVEGLSAFRQFVGLSA